MHRDIPDNPLPGPLTSLRQKLAKIICTTDTRAGRWFDIVIQLLIWLSIISICIETLPSLKESQKEWLETINFVIVIIFTLEYVLRLVVTPKPIRYALSIYGIIDLLAIFPFYLQLSIDLRALRVLRLFRIVRAFKLFRYSRAIERFRIAFKSIAEELVIFLFAAVFLFVIASLGLYQFENKAQPDVFASVFDAMWWSVVTLTTVGYGDAYPVTIGGKIFTSIILVIGLGVVAVPTGLLAAALSRTEMEEAQDEQAADEREKHLAETGQLTMGDELVLLEKEIDTLQRRVRNLQDKAK